MPTTTELAYPSVDLNKGAIRVSMYLPDAVRGYYRGTRFDWSGIIRQVRFRDHQFYAPLHPSHDPTCHDAVSGPAEEFAMFRPMGFAEASPGQSFVKIGVGLLMKADEGDYSFDGNYELICAGDWDISHNTDSVTFDQALQGERGWAYRYTKSIQLSAGRPELTIRHRLENTGEKTIDIDNYNHNFTIIDDVPVGPDYRVEFPFTTDDPISIGDLGRFRADAVEIEKPLGEDSLWVELYDGKGRIDYNQAIVRNLRSGAAVEFRGDAPVTRMVFWAVERAACPEPFIHLLLAPGQCREWSSRYRFSVDHGTT